MAYVDAEASARPVMLFDGNCHAHHLAAIFNGAGLADAYTIGDDWGFVPSYRRKLATFIDAAAGLAIVEEAKARGRHVIQVSQVTQVLGSQSFGYSGLVDQIVKFPNIEFYACSPDAFAKRFGSKQPLLRVLKLDLGAIEHCQKQCDTEIDFARVIKDNIPHKPLFHTVTHPGGLITSLLFKCVAQKVQMIPQSTVDWVQYDLSQTEGLNFDNEPGYPVTKAVLSELGFVWGDWYDDYRQMILDGNAGRHKAFLRNFRRYRKRFPRDTLFWRFTSEAAIARGRGRLAAVATSRLTDLSPGWGPGWTMRYDFWHRRRNKREMEKTIADARAAHGTHRQLYSIMAAFEQRNGRFDAAIAHARTFSAKTSSRADGPVIIIAFMIWAGRRSEALEEARKQAAAMNAGERDHFNNRLKEFGIDLSSQ